MTYWVNAVMDVIRALERDNSRSGKDAIIARETLKHQEPDVSVELLKVFQYCYDPHRLYGVIPDYVTVETGRIGVNPTPERFFAFLDDLQAGRAGREKVNTALQSFEPDAASLLWRILKHDLRCGITETTINKVIPGHIFKFEPMLCHPFEQKRVRSWPVAAEWKRDGYRCIIKVNKAEVKFMSRTGKSKFASFPDLEEEVKTLQLRMGWDEVFLDGELTRGKDFNDVGSCRSHGTIYDANLHLFEILSPDEFAGRGIAQYAERHLRMDHIGEFTWIKPEPMRLCNTIEDVQWYFGAVREKKGEGIIIKQLDGLYYPKRCYEWMKMKGLHTIDLKVVDWEEGTGKYTGQIGALWVEDATGRRICKVGQGFTDEQRKELYAEYHGSIIEIEYLDLTPDKSLRNPVFMRIRDDKEVADVVPT